MKQIDVINAARPFLIDDRDYPLVSPHRWQRSGRTFATVIDGCVVTINKLLCLGNVAPRDGDPFNLQRDNLERQRIPYMVTHAVGLRNSSH